MPNMCEILSVECSKPLKWIKTLVNLVYYGFGLDWVKKNLQIFIRFNKNSAHPDWICDESDWLANSYGYTHYVGLCNV